MCLCCPAKGVLSGDQFVQHETECELVRTKVERTAAGLLRRHIARGSGDGTEVRVHRGSVASVARFFVVQPKFSQAEIQNLDGLSRDDDVLWLQVSVDDAHFMGLGESFGDLHGDGNYVAHRWNAVGNQLPQSRPFDELQHQKIDALIVPDVVQGADIGVGEFRNGARFMLEPLAQFHILREPFG